MIQQDLSTTIDSLVAVVEVAHTLQSCIPIPALQIQLVTHRNTLGLIIIVMICWGVLHILCLWRTITFTINILATRIMPTLCMVGMVALRYSDTMKYIR